ncbi:hypothetical protein [Vibrio parahaemolyticus]|uniref:hypothetical protein n=1 Tax=Vibrio parahaemolyticus TaxID=670 RepID=UPI00226A7B09|nr:hypothetical protein [Vibrio parahaemolyticus]MCX8828199.1 hypothetical protein [Vibrio parahaemolyticus]
MKNISCFLFPVSCFLFPVLFPVLAYANIQVSPMVTTISGKTREERVERLSIKSLSDKVQLISVVTKKIINPATNKQKEVDYSYNDKDCALVTIPQTLVLPPGSTRNIKLISTCTPYQEQIYRTRVSGIPNDINVDNKNTDSANIAVSLSWGTLVHVLPENSMVKFMIKDGNLFNYGNVSAKVSTVSLCASKLDCEDVKIEKSLFPNGNFISLSEHINLKTKAIRIKYDAYNISNNEVELIL